MSCLVDTPEPASVSSSTSTGPPIAKQNRQQLRSNHRRPRSMPLSPRDYSSLSDLKELFNSPPNNIYQTTRTKLLPNLSFPTGLVCSFCIITGIVSLHSLYHSHFDTPRVAFVVSLSVVLLPFVRPVRWLTKIMFRLSLWACFFPLAFSVRTARYFRDLATNIIRDVRRNSKYTANRSGKLFVVQSAIGAIALYLFISEIPLLRIALLGTKFLRFTFKLLRAFVLLQYYMILLSILELMIYLRVDCILDVIGAAWFRWAAQRVWSVTTWADIILAASPSAFYYLHLSFAEDVKR